MTDESASVWTWQSVESALTPFTTPTGGGFPMPPLADLDALADFLNHWVKENREALNTVFFGSDFTLWDKEQTKRAVSVLNRDIPLMIHSLTMPEQFKHLTALPIEKLQAALSAVKDVEMLLPGMRSRKDGLKIRPWHGSALGLARNICTSVRKVGASPPSLSGQAALPRAVHAILVTFSGMNLGNVEAVGMLLHRHRIQLLAAERQPCDFV